MDEKLLISKILDKGAKSAAEIDVINISFNSEFRKACEANSCGSYGACWMCPPDVGEIEALIKRAKEFKSAVVYQTVWELSDSFDFEGMLIAQEGHDKLSQDINNELPKIISGKYLHLGAGSCRICPRCGKKDNIPCRHPDKAIPSLESYGISVSSLAEKCSMKYINGVNTVTYFGAVLF